MVRVTFKNFYIKIIVGTGTGVGTGIGSGAGTHLY
jgi:hypothetical protein